MPAHEGERKEVHVQVNDIESIGLLVDAFQLEQVEDGRIAFVARQPQGFCNGGDQSGGADRIPTGKQGHVMTLANEFFRQIRNDPLRASIEPGRDALEER
jgi:hypothetical protein